MLINRISVEKFGPWNQFEINNVDQGLSLIYGENGTGKTALRRFISAILFGHQWNSSNGSDLNRTIPPKTRLGELEVTHGTLRLAIDRYANEQGQLNSTIRNLETASTPYRAERFINQNSVDARSVAALTAEIDENFYNEVYNIGFRDTQARINHLAAIYEGRFQVPRGRTQLTSNVDLDRLKEKQAVADRIRQTLSELESRRLSLTNRIGEHTAGRRHELDSIRTQISELSNQIIELESSLHRLRRRKMELDVEIDQLRRKIEMLRSQTQAVRKPNHLQELIKRYNLVVSQLHRWRKVHLDVQSQRKKLRNELVRWENEQAQDWVGTQNPELHALLKSIEGRVFEMESYLATVRATRGQIESDELCSNMELSIRSMREETLQLCREVNNQYYNYRQKFAIQEFKQLRRCYTEVNDHLSRLTTRREKLIREIAKYDPARAEYLARNPEETYQVSSNDSVYLGHEYDTVHRRQVDVDVSAELARLHQLEDEQRRNAHDTETSSADILRLQHRREKLIARQEELERLLNDEHLRSELDDVQRRIREEQTRLDSILHQIEIERKPVHREQAAIIRDASNFLSNLTEKELTGVWISQYGDSFEVQQANGQIQSYANLSRSNQDLVRMSLVMAAARETTSRLPMLLDDPFVNLDENSIRIAIEVISEFCREGRQVITTSCHNYVAEIFERMQVGVVRLASPVSMPLPLVRPQPIIQEITQPVVSTRAMHFAPPVVQTPISYVPDVAEAVTDWSSHDYDYIDSDVMTTGTIVEATNYLSDLLDFDEHGLSPQANEIFTNRMIDSDQVVQAADVHFDRTENSKLSQTKLFTDSEITGLGRIGIFVVAELLDYDFDEAPESSDHGFRNSLAKEWQSQSLMWLSVPEMTSSEIQAVTASGITTEDLSDMSSSDLMDRVRNYMNMSGRSFNGLNFDRDRFSRWSNRARGNRAYRNRYSRQRFRHSNAERDNDRDRLPISKVTQREQTTEYSRRKTIQSTAQNNGSAEESTETFNGKPLKFYLSTTSDVEAAPSLGPRMAERLYRANVHTVSDLLNTPAETIHQRIDYKRVKVEDIRAWQHQATFVCRVPFLRGHDAQLLVGVGITEVEDLISKSPEAVLSLVGPFSKTKEGIKIIRNGNPPDLEEVTDWVNWAKRTRPLMAA